MGLTLTLPYLKHEKESGSASSDSEGSDYSMLDAIAEDLMTAFEKSRKSMVKEALQALCDYLQEQDQIQDSKEGTK
jgi:hypothetical protein